MRGMREKSWFCFQCCVEVFSLWDNGVKVLNSDLYYEKHWKGECFKKRGRLLKQKHEKQRHEKTAYCSEFILFDKNMRVGCFVEWRCWSITLVHSVPALLRNSGTGVLTEEVWPLSHTLTNCCHFTKALCLGNKCTSFSFWVLPELWPISTNVTSHGEFSLDHPTSNVIFPLNYVSLCVQSKHNIRKWDWISAQNPNACF